jgi:tape measure domain-containing protein
MAGGEIYRVEIPIIVDDQTDAPLQQAERRIGRFERQARRETEQARQHLTRIARMQIEPVMRIRDQLTSNVLRADRLISRLDAAQASPLITAQDRVSAVVVRVNAMLNALDNGQVDVVADMRGPLLDEIVRARTALSALDNVRAGPVAELRGELFGQLSRAMSQIRGLDLSRAEPQATLRERIMMRVREISSGLRSLTARAWDITLQVRDRATSVIKGIAGKVGSIIDKLTSPLALLGAGAGLGAGILYPLKLAGEFEQAQMSLDFYMGSVEEGKRAFQDLIRFAKETPFEFPFLQGATIQLMGAGYNFEQAKRALLAFGDAAGRTGAGMQGIEASLLGFTQIASAGTLNLQDLKQVALNLKLPLNIFARELGVAESELGDIGRAGISSQKAMEAIVKTLEQRFKGGMKELSNSLLGMTAVIKDTATLTVWHFGKGMAEPVKRIMFDIIGLTEDTGGKFEEFQKRLEHVGERVGLKFEQMYEGAKQFFSDLTNAPGWNEMSWSEKVTVALDKILEAVTAWLKGPGGEAIKKTGEILGSLLAAGLEGALPNIVPIAVNLGLALGKGILSGIWEALTSNPVVGAILGALGGAKVGALAGTVGGLPGVVVGGVGGAVVGGGAALIRRALSDKHAMGGILTRPHLGLVAEAGPEAIIPLSTRMRARALALYEETGRQLGVRPYAVGGFAGPVPVAVPAVAGFGAPTGRAPISVTNYIDVTVGGSNADSDRIAEAIATKIESVFQNMTK